METRSNKRRHSYGSDDFSKNEEVKKQRRMSFAFDALRHESSGNPITHETSEINLSGILGSSSNLPNELPFQKDVPVVELPLTNEESEEKPLVNSDATITQSLKSESERRNSDGSIGERVKERRNSKSDQSSSPTKPIDPMEDFFKKQYPAIQEKALVQIFLPTAASAIHTPKFDLNNKEDKLFLDILKSYVADLKELFGENYKKIIVGTTKTSGLAQLLFRKENSPTGDYDLYYVNISVLSGNPEAWKPKLLKNPDSRGHAFLFMLKALPGIPSIYPPGYEDLPQIMWRVAVLGTSGHGRLTLDEPLQGVLAPGEHTSGRPDKINSFSGTFRSGANFESEGIPIFTIKNGKYAEYKDFIYEYIGRKFLNGAVYEAPKKQKSIEKEENKEKKYESSRFFLHSVGKNTSVESLPSIIDDKDEKTRSEKKRPASPTEGEDPTKKRKMSR